MFAKRDISCRSCFSYNIIALSSLTKKYVDDDMLHAIKLAPSSSHLRN